MAAVVFGASAFQVNFVCRLKDCRPNVILTSLIRSLNPMCTSLKFKHQSRNKNLKILPPPHVPVEYSERWNYPKHNITPEKIESYEPSKLLMVRKIATLRKREAWEKYIMTHFGINGKRKHIAIVKNTPSVNVLLWRVKHLIEVRPITFPYGLPEKGDYTGTYLNQNGEFIVSKKLKLDENVAKIRHEDELRLTTHYLRNYYLRKWNQKWEELP